MDYEKKYKKALEKAKKLATDLPNGRNDRLYHVDDLEHILPELKESEDERIRKDLLGYLHTLPNHFSHNGSLVTEWIAWLEKQGEQKHLNDNFPSFDEAQGTIIVEKQGEQKPVIIPKFRVGDTIKHKSGDDTCYTIVDIVNDSYMCNNNHSWSISSQDYFELVEQKPADKVEPKFHEGDWVIDKQGIVHQIAKVIENVTNHTYGYDIVGGGYFNDSTEGVRLWTIQDAKDGDVLSYRDGQWIFIYKGIVTEDTFKYYALLSEKGITVNDAAFSLLLSFITPATKEQRDTLMKAMADAGYTFDFEKKELKKIEQKPAKDSGKVSEYTTEEKDMTEYKKGFECGKQRVLKYPEDFDLCKRTLTAWSEEDKNVLEDIEEAIINYWHGDTQDILLDWLKSLKDRYTWKPSEEQMKALGIAIRCGIQLGTWEEDALKSLAEQLKKLKG